MNKSLSKYIVRRRMSVTQLVQQLWDAVKVIKCQHHTPTLEKIAKYMSRTHSVSEEEVSRQLQNCVRDGLLHIMRSKAPKGSKHGAEQEVYKLPEPSEGKQMEKETHDWYCFTCHAYGDVILCTKCYRVYHCSCLPEGSASDKYVCDVCKKCDEDNSLADLKLRKLNRLLSFICKHLQDKYTQLNNSNEFLRRPIYIPSHGAQMDISTAKESWRVPFLVYKPFDLNTMKALAEAQKYQNVAEFIAHAQLIVHAVVIFHGDLSRIADTSRQMLRECMSKVEEMQACPSCYERAVLKHTKNWFCKPCRPPHELCFAGSPYMPAKVLQEKGEKRLVVFFGLEHSRIMVDREATLPIDTPIRNLGKTTASWSRAMNELAIHQKLLDTDLPLSSSDEEENNMSKESSRIVSKEKDRIPNKDSPIQTTPSKTERLASVKEEPLRAEVKNETVKRKPGRPSKRPTYSSDEEDEVVKVEPVKRRRGRPPKNPTPAPVQAKRRGRPRRVKQEEKEEKMEEEVEEEEEEEEEEEQKEEEMEEEEEEEKEKEVEMVSEAKPEERRPESPTTTVSTASTLKKNEEEIVSSSCMEPQVRHVSTQTSNNKKDKANKEALLKLKEELDEVRVSHAEELKALKEAHTQEIAATKKKQWCYNCEQEAIYHCCWNTAYCSTECQQVHWQREHKRVCRRKR